MKISCVFYGGLEQKWQAHSSLIFAFLLLGVVPCNGQRKIEPTREMRFLWQRRSGQSFFAGLCWASLWIMLHRGGCERIDER